MPDNFGSQGADRILEDLNRQKDSRAWQLRKGDILKTDPPVFFEVMAEKLKDLVDGFNVKMQAANHQTLTYKRHDGDVVIVEKTAEFTCQAILQVTLNRVLIKIITVKGIEGIEGKHSWAFDANETDGLLLNGKQAFGCAEVLFTLIAQAYRAC